MRASFNSNHPGYQRGVAGPYARVPNHSLSWAYQQAALNQRSPSSAPEPLLPTGGSGFGAALAAVAAIAVTAACYGALWLYRRYAAARAA